MSKIIFKTLFKKEAASILNSHSFWISTLFFYFALSIAFIGIPVWFDIGLSDLSYFFSLFPFVYIVVIPMLTIELWTDEYKRRTSELLFLFPVSITEIVCTKFLACAFCFFIQLFITIIIPLSVLPLIFFHVPSFLFSYCACLCFGLACIALSLALSAVTSESALAFACSFFTIAFFSLLHLLIRLIPLHESVQTIIETISFNKHFQNAALGILDFGDYIFYASLILFGISLNVFILKQKRIRQ